MESCHPPTPADVAHMPIAPAGLCRGDRDFGVNLVSYFFGGTPSPKISFSIAS